MSDLQRQVALEFGYSEAIISLTLSRLKFNTSGDLIDYLDIHEEELEEEVIRREKANLRDDTERLYRSSLCVMCVKNAREIVILPCGHYCLCVACEKQCRFCPVKKCAMLITFAIRTFQA